MNMPVAAPLVSAPVNLPSSNDNSSSPSTSSTSSSQPASSANHDTKVFGNLEGRDPDLLFAGEKIMINGKEVTVADGDTLSSLALKHGTTVDKLISENKMDSSLLGKNGPNGAYFTPGGPQPAPGGSQAPRTDPLAPAGPNGTYTKEQVPALRAEVERLQKDGALASDKATQLLGLLQKVENGGTLTAQEATDLTSLMKDLKTAQGSSTQGAQGSAPVTTSPPSTNGDDNPPVRQAHLSAKDSYGLQGGEIDQDRLTYLQGLPRTPPKGTELTETQLDRVQEILQGLKDKTIKDGGIKLDQQDKNILNLWMKESGVAG